MKPKTAARSPEPANDSRIVTGALLKAGDFMGLSQTEIGEMVGVSASTVSRMKDSRARLEAGSKPYQLATLFLRAWRSLDAIVGSNDTTARQWLRSPNAGLNEARPIDLLGRPEGLVRVCDYLDARRGRV